MARDHRAAEAQVALHAARGAGRGSGSAGAVALVDVLLVELERQRLRAGDDLELVDLQLDLAGREVRVDGLGRARGDLALGADDELVAHVVGDRGRLRRRARG